MAVTPVVHFLSSFGTRGVPFDDRFRRGWFFSSFGTGGMSFDDKLWPGGMLLWMSSG